MPDDITFLHGRHRPRCIASVDKRFDYFTLQLMTSGAVELWYDDHRYELHGSWAWPCFPGPWVRFHEWPRGDSWDHRYLAFTGPRVAAWEADGLWPRQPQQVAPDQQGEMARHLDDAIDLAAQPGRWPRLRAVNLLERVLLDLAVARSAAPSQPEWLDTVLNALGAGDATPDYAELARSVNMSLTTLRRRFRSTTGFTLHGYRLERRIADARHLLGNTDVPIKTIAARLGYTDVFYFTRQFTQVTGVPPATYRRSRQ